MKSIITNLYILKNKTNKMYFRTKLFQGSFHWVADINDATELSKLEAVKLLKELKHRDNFEIIKKGTIGESNESKDSSKNNIRRNKKATRTR